MRGMIIARIGRSVVLAHKVSTIESHLNVDVAR